MFCISLVIILLFLAMKIYKIDNIDRTNPFGTDTYKNKKYTNGISGEDYGVGTFWGKPSKKDDTLDNLNKIQWLSGSVNNDVLWRRSIVIAIFSAVLLSFAIDYNILLYDPSKFLLIVFLIFLTSYFSINYYRHHVLWRRNKFINTHVRKIKSKLNLTQHNKITENHLI